jgi:hypothetical protein
MTVATAEPEVYLAGAAKLVDRVLEDLLLPIEDPVLIDAVLARLLGAAVDAASFGYADEQIVDIVASRLAFVRHVEDHKNPVQ